MKGPDCQRDPLLDTNGVPVRDLNGCFVTDTSQPRQPVRHRRADLGCRRDVAPEPTWPDRTSAAAMAHGLYRQLRLSS